MIALAFLFRYFMVSMKAYWVLFVFFCGTYGYAQPAIYEFLRTDIGARAAGLNGSFLTIQNDPNSLFYNPASLSSITHPQISFGYFKHLAGINAGNASYVDTFEAVGTIGIGVLYFDYGTFERVDATEEVVGTFGASDVALIGGWGTMLDEVTSIGISAEFIHSSIAEFTSSALAIGIGMTYSVPSQNLVIGGSILHFGKQLTSYRTTKESLPLDVSIGLTKRPEHLPAYLNLVFHRLNRPTKTFAERLRAFTFGVEFLLSSSLRFRVGYNNERRKDWKLLSKTELAGFSFGGGVVLKEYLVDYAYNSFGNVGGIHHVSVGIVFK
ncbi:MAG: type IX secretion system protein PorQ [Bacteroidetes bacterium]|nr:type IX secretion system protein PorQ [Bacteroidota bacterium]